MVGKNLSVIWDDQAKEFLRKAVEYIKLDSPQNAEKVKKDIRAAAKDLSKYPTRYPPDKYRLYNDGSYRCFLMHNLRITYFIGPEKIRIVDLRHSKQAPIYY